MSRPELFRRPIAIGLALIATAVAGLPCSTFLLKKGEVVLVGHNLDERTHVPGLVVINKRGVEKAAVSWASLVSGKPDTTPPLSWTSRYASISFNPFGRDFPDDGMNEAGLFIGEMTLTGTKFPQDGSKPQIFMCLWMQHVLDTCQTVEEVLASASSLVIDGWGWHFFAADRTGRSASLEFKDGRLVVHAGQDMPVPVLCNSWYEEETARLRTFQGFGGEKPVNMQDQEVPRFVHAARMLEDYSPSKKPAVDYAFDILRQLERGGTQWSLVCDLMSGKAHFRSARSPGIKSVALKDFDPDCAKPARLLDLHADLSGDAAGYFQDYSLEANRDFAAKAMDALLKLSPNFDKLVRLQGSTMQALAERVATYPERTQCRK